MRIDRIFNEKVCGVDEMVEQVKVILWHWSLSRLKIATCLFYEWNWNPVLLAWSLSGWFTVAAFGGGGGSLCVAVIIGVLLFSVV